MQVKVFTDTRRLRRHNVESARTVARGAGTGTPRRASTGARSGNEQSCPHHQPVTSMRTHGSRNKKRSKYLMCIMRAVLVRQWRQNFFQKNKQQFVLECAQGEAKRQREGYKLNQDSELS